MRGGDRFATQWFFWSFDPKTMTLSHENGFKIRVDLPWPQLVTLMMQEGFSPGDQGLFLDAIWDIRQRPGYKEACEAKKKADEERERSRQELLEAARG